MQDDDVACGGVISTAQCRGGHHADARRKLSLVPPGSHTRHPAPFQRRVRAACPPVAGGVVADRREARLGDDGHPVSSFCFEAGRACLAGAGAEPAARWCRSVRGDCLGSPVDGPCVARGCVAHPGKRGTGWDRGGHLGPAGAVPVQHERGPRVLCEAVAHASDADAALTAKSLVSPPEPETGTWTSWCRSSAASAVDVPRCR